jgi:SagB-type dehydrogenase family enzyme
MDSFKNNRNFMKSGFDLPEREFVSDQERGLPAPPVDKAIDSNLKIIELPPVDKNIIKQSDLYSCLNKRRSRRNYIDAPITLEELSFLLWSTQGVQRVIPAYKKTGHITLRPVPSAGGRHTYETYLAVNNVEGLEKGIYIYLPLEHKLAFCYCDDSLPEKLTYAYGGENYIDEAIWLGKAPVVFLWSCIPYRGEWRYHCEAHRLMLLDIGHVCQNLYLACEGIGCGTCAIAGYVQEAFDDLLRVDGQNEYVVYISAVGKLK